MRFRKLQKQTQLTKILKEGSGEVTGTLTDNKLVSLLYKGQFNLATKYIQALP